MAMKSLMQEEKLTELIRSSLLLMCKTSLQYESEVEIKGLLGITVDKSNVFLVDVKELVQTGIERNWEGGDAETQSANNLSSAQSKRVKRRWTVTNQQDKPHPSKQKKHDYSHNVVVPPEKVQTLELAANSTKGTLIKQEVDDSLEVLHEESGGEKASDDEETENEEDKQAFLENPDDATENVDLVVDLDYHQAEGLTHYVTGASHSWNTIQQDNQNSDHSYYCYNLPKSAIKSRMDKRTYASDVSQPVLERKTQILTNEEGHDNSQELSDFFAGSSSHSWYAIDNVDNIMDNISSVRRNVESMHERKSGRSLLNLGKTVAEPQATQYVVTDFQNKGANSSAKKQQVTFIKIIPARSVLKPQAAKPPPDTLLRGKNKKHNLPIIYKKSKSKSTLSVSEATVRKSCWAVKVFNSWRDQVMTTSLGGKVPHSLEDFVNLSYKEVCETLVDFVSNAKKQDGQLYPPRTIYELILAIVKHISVNYGKEIPVFSHDDFQPVKTAFDDVADKCSKEGVSMDRKSGESISNEQIDHLWQTGVLGDSNPKQLLDTLFWLIASNFGICNRADHRTLSVDNFILGEAYGRRYIQLVNTDDFKCKVKNKHIKVFENTEDPTRCLYRIFNKYKELMPANPSEKALYYYPDTHLGNILLPGTKWYGTQPLGRNVLGKKVKIIMQQGGFRGHYTNLSLRTSTQ